MRSFRVSCVFRIVRVKRSFVSFAFFVRLRLVRIVSLYDPGSVSLTNNVWRLIVFAPFLIIIIIILYYRNQARNN